jgi:hypothetical protein
LEPVIFSGAPKPVNGPSTGHGPQLFLERNLSSGNFATRISANHLARLGFAGVVMVIIIIILSCADCDSLFSHC